MDKNCEKQNNSPSGTICLAPLTSVVLVGCSMMCRCVVVKNGRGVLRRRCLVVMESGKCCSKSSVVRLVGFSLEYTGSRWNLPFCSAHPRQGTGDCVRGANSLAFFEIRFAHNQSARCSNLEFLPLSTIEQPLHWPLKALGALACPPVLQSRGRLPDNHVCQDSPQLRSDLQGWAL